MPGSGAGEAPVPLLGSCRFVLTLMVFFGVYHLMALRFNLSMALGNIDVRIPKSYNENFLSLHDEGSNRRRETQHNKCSKLPDREVYE